MVVFLVAFCHQLLIVVSIGIDKVDPLSCSVTSAPSSGRSSSPTHLDPAYVLYIGAYPTPTNKQNI